ncbi:MAG: hypothetical protein IKH27_09170 [Oscillospiraceae bacterium]|nr:hypothetical protein [Oscillospiraceae bacterium]
MLLADFLVLLGQNLLFSEFLGIPSVADAGRRGKGLLRAGIFTLFFCTFGAGFTSLLRNLLSVRTEKLFFPLCIAAVCGVMDILLMLLFRLISKKMTEAIAPQLHAAACSSAVLAAILYSTDYTHEFGIALRYGFRMGCGYLLACILLRLAIPTICGEKMPAAVRGWRGLFLYCALLSMAGACMFPTA